MNGGCWLCEGYTGFWSGAHWATCGVCHGSGEYQPLPPRPSIMAILGSLHVSGDFTLTKEDARWSLMWAEALS